MPKHSTSCLSLKSAFLLLLLLLVVIQFGSARTENSTVSDELEALDLEELQEKLRELYHESISLKEYETKDKAIKAIKKKENELREEAAFEANVEAAAARREKAFGDVVHSVHAVVDVKSGYGKTFEEYKEFFRMSLPNFDDLEFSMEPYTNTNQAHIYLSYLPYLGYFCLFLVLSCPALPLPERVKNFIRTRSQILITTGLLLSTAGSTRSTAFEILVDNQLVYSGLQSRRPPSAPHLRRILLTRTLLQDYQ